jgi:hypothetical protein
MGVVLDAGPNPTIPYKTATISSEEVPITTGITLVWGTPVQTSVTSAARIVDANALRRAFQIYIQSGSIYYRWDSNPSSTIYQGILTIGQSLLLTGDALSQQSFHALSVSGTAVINTTEATAA